MNDHRIDCRACKGSGVTYFGQECTCNQRDCWHGSLARSCELCERDDDIEDRDKTIQSLTAERDQLAAQARQHMLDAGRWEQDASHWRATADELAAQVAALHLILMDQIKPVGEIHRAPVYDLHAAAAVFVAAKRVADALYHSERVYFASDSVLSQEFEEYRKALAGEG